MRESNPQGSSLDRFRGGCHRQIGLTFRIAKLRQKGSNLHPLLNRQVDYRYLMPDQKSGWPDLNRRSRAPAKRTRNTRLSYILPASPKRTVPLLTSREVHRRTDSFGTLKSPAGVEPALPPWQGDRLPLHHGRVMVCRIVKEQQSTGRDSNSRRRITGAVSSPLDDQCHHSLQWDQRDLNPHLAGLRVRCAAANTLIPYFVSSPVGAEGIEPSTGSL